MDYFYVIVLSIAVALLILLLAYLGLSLKRKGSSSSTTWPPVESTCPDYWKISTTDPNSCLIPPLDSSNPTQNPRNTGSIYVKLPDSNNLAMDNAFKTNTRAYNNSTNSINFNDSYYSICNKKNWSKTYGVYWDGYTNYNGC
jgi:hypothetical protein